MISVSIIIPVYNVEQYIGKCLQSVMSQTYQGEIECILVDDCGSDNSIRVAEDAIAQYTGPISFLIVHHDVNKGLPAARNTGIRHVRRGRYLFFMDSDDYISDLCIEKMVACVERDSSIQMVIGNTLPVPSTEQRLRHHDLKYMNLPEKYIDNASIRKKFYDLQSSLPYCAWNKLISYDFLISNKLYFRERIYNEDVHWTYFVYRKLESVVFLSDYTYMYVTNPNSIMHTVKEKDNADSWAVVIDDFLNSLDADYFHSQFTYCFRRFCPWYMNFSDLSPYKKLYHRFLVIALKNLELKITTMLCLMPVKVFIKRLLLR